MLENTSSEIELLRACVKGNTTAFETIVKKYQSLVCAITFSATANLDKSEELAQEAFIRAWTNITQLKDLTKFRAWLCSIVRNIVRNYMRDKKRDVVGKATSIDKMADIS
ncbi:MAG: RNA polymerase sigma factor, partial [Planctomycetota bacterium]